MPARILVAEDDPEMLRIVAEGLRLDGHSVEMFRDGGRLLMVTGHGPAITSDASSTVRKAVATASL
jgi:CheY-like chemotaxis protein